jgi:hypothetical protein
MPLKNDTQQRSIYLPKSAKNIIINFMIKVILLIVILSSVILTSVILPMEQPALINVNNCLNTNIYPYLVTSSGKSFNIYLKVVCFLAPVLIRYLWQLKTVISLIGV